MEEGAWKNHCRACGTCRAAAWKPRRGVRSRLLACCWKRPCCHRPLTPTAALPPWATALLLPGTYKASVDYLLIYMGLVLLFVMLLLCRDSTFSVWSVRASTRMHNNLFTSVLNAPILFFLRTPVGDVLNAFARDQVRAGGKRSLCLAI